MSFAVVFRVARDTGEIEDVEVLGSWYTNTDEETLCLVHNYLSNYCCQGCQCFEDGAEWKSENPSYRR